MNEKLFKRHFGNVQKEIERIGESIINVVNTTKQMIVVKTSQKDSTNGTERTLDQSC